jgi:hypothetical protein
MKAGRPSPFHPSSLIPLPSSGGRGRAQFSSSRDCNSSNAATTPLKGLALSAYLSDIPRPVVTRDYAHAQRKLDMEGGPK